MASQTMIPTSNDTLFIRGFSSRHHIDEIRDFFTHEGGRNTVEFFKETNSGDQLFIALKFESKSIAKDVLNRFDGYEVLGDRISLSWYKDIRKARAYENSNYRRIPGQQWQSDRYDYRQGGGGAYGRGGRDNRTNSYRGGQRSGWYQRGSDYSEGGSRSRRYTRSSSRSRSRSASARSHSHTASRSSSREERGSRSHSDDSRERTRKRRRSTSEASNRRASRKGKGRGSSSSASPEPDAGSQSESDSLPPPTEQAVAKKTKGASKKANANSSLERRTPSAGRDSKTKEYEAHVEGEPEGSDVNEFAADEGLSSPPQPVPPPAGNTKAGRAVRSAVTTVERTVAVSKRSAAAAAAAAAKNMADDAAVEAANTPAVDSSSSQPNSATRKHGAVELAKEATKAKKKDRRAMEGAGSDDDEMFAEKAPLSRKQARDNDEFMYERPKKSKDMVPMDSDGDNAADYMFDDGGPPPPKRKAGASGKKAERNAPKEFDPFEDDEDALLVEANTRRRPDEPSRSGRPGPPGKRSGPGAVGLSFEKMQMVRQKKEEIEKAYRQDCETFATVTKMLISKEPTLEEKIQNSLRENLKDIGHRCIQELRDFIERLKEEDIDDV